MAEEEKFEQSEEVSSEEADLEKADSVKKEKPESVGPEESEKQKEFYLDSLLDLEDEFEAGEIEKRDYRKLKSAYTKRASRAIAGKPAISQRRDIPFYKKGVVLLMAFILILGTAAGIVLGLTSGQRQSGEEITGDVRPSSGSLLEQGQEALALAGNSDDPNKALALFQVAFARFDEALEDSPANTEALKGRIQALQGRSLAELRVETPEIARKTLQSALELDTENITTLRLLINLDVNLHAPRLLTEYAGIELDNYPDSLGEGVPVPTKYSDLGLPNPEVGRALISALIPPPDDQGQRETRGIPLAVLISGLMANEADTLFTDESEIGEAYIQYGFLLVQLFPPGSSNSDKGFESMQKAIDLRPEDADYRRIRAEFYSSILLYPEALTSIDEAIELAPEEVLHLQTKIIILFSSGATEAALMLANEAVDQFPNEEGAFYIRSQLLWGEERFEEALEDVDMAIDLLDMKISDLEGLTQKSDEQAAELNSYLGLQNEVAGFKAQLDAVLAQPTTTTAATPTTQSTPTTEPTATTTGS